MRFPDHFVKISGKKNTLGQKTCLNVYILCKQAACSDKEEVLGSSSVSVSLGPGRRIGGMFWPAKNQDMLK